jgi:ABC-2 type transport system ATP-binding protein
MMTGLTPPTAGGVKIASLQRSRADDLLEPVGLGAAGAKPVGDYSLGMRQRLGIGAALLGDPLVLILDEPANGMDPEGIRWMRLLLRDFAADGGTALLTSHLLGEVQATVDRLVVIADGRIVADDDLPTLLAGQGTVVRGLEPAALVALFHRAGITVEPRPDGTLRAAATAEHVGRLAAAAGLVILELRDGGGLEDLFFQLTSTH